MVTLKLNDRSDWFFFRSEIVIVNLRLRRAGLKHMRADIRSNGTLGQRIWKDRWKLGTIPWGLQDIGIFGAAARKEGIGSETAHEKQEET